MGKPLVVGSIGFDLVFSIHGRIRDKVKVTQGEIDKLDLLFTAQGLSRRFGGTAGNIAYGLGQLGKQPLMFGVVGDDYEHEYQPHIVRSGVDDRSVVEAGQHTATYYAISDEDKELIAVWQPNIHERQHDYPLADRVDDWDEIEIAIFSPGTAQSIVTHMQEVKALAPQAKLIFDPGPIINFFPQDLLQKATELADIIIGNEVEIPLLTEKLGKTVEELNNNGIKHVIETLGDKGAQIFSKDSKVMVDPVPTDSFVEATGAGDAFRAGLIAGLLDGKTMEDAVKLGAHMGSLNVATHGGQEYKIDSI